MRCSDESRHPPYRVREVLAVGLMFACAGLAAFVGVGAWLGGMTAALRYGLGIAVLFALIGVTGIALRSDRQVDRDVSTVGDALELKQSGRVWGLLVSMMTCLAVLAIGAAVEIGLHASGSGVPAASPIFGLFGLAVAAVPVLAVSGRLQRGWVRLSPSGITHRGACFESHLPWEAVAGAKTAYNGFHMVLVIGYTNGEWNRKYTTPIWRLEKLPPVPMIALDCRKFDIDNVLLARVIEFYANSSDMRAELGTAGALARFRERAYA